VNNMLNTPDVPPEHPFAPYIRILGKGKSGTRSLTEHEAEAAFGMLLRNETDPLQLGAFLMLLRVKEETGEELAGFVRACRANMTAPPLEVSADLDWSSYAGKKHQQPWFILSQLLLAQAGYRVFIHGSDGHTQGRLYTEDALRQLGLPVAVSWVEAAQHLDEHRFSYLSLRHFCQPLHAMMQLRALLGLRSPVNTLARMINPLNANASIQSVFHPAYTALHQRADELLGQAHSLVFKGDSGEVEIKPQADTRLCLQSGGEPREETLQRSRSGRVDSVQQLSVQPLRSLWRAEAEDAYGLDATIATATAALLLLEPKHTPTSARTLALQLWTDRDPQRLN